jgi:methionine-S-sulfoxide reductase
MRDNAEHAVLAGGCFWIMQQLLRDGVISTRVGWTGGENDNPTEENNSGHAEAVGVGFDPERLSYRELLEFFFQVHRPDLDERLVGSSYRSEIFYTSEEQRKVAEDHDYFQRYPDGCAPPFPGPGEWPRSFYELTPIRGPSHQSCSRALALTTVDELWGYSPLKSTIAALVGLVGRVRGRA